MLKLFYRYLKPYKWMVFLAPVFMIVEVAMELVQPRFMARIIDKGIAQGDLRCIWITSLIMLGTTAVGMIGGVGCTIFSSMAAQYFGTDLREALFKKVLGLSFAETDRFSTASMITRLTQDVQQVQQMIGMSLRMLVRQPFMLVGGISMAMHIHPKLALILLVLIPPLIVLVTITFKYSRPMFMAIQTKTDALNAVLQENLTGVRVVKAFVREDYENEKFGKSNKSLADQHLTTSRFMSGMMPAMMFLMNLGIIAVLWIGGWTIRRGELTVGEVVAMVNYITQILFSFMFASFIMTDIARSKVSAERLNSTGSGKSTLVHLLPRFYDIDSGMVAIDGHNVQDYELSELRSLMGMVLQESVLFSGTIAENIRWGNPDATDEQVVEVAKAAQAYEFITRFKDGFKTIVGQRGVTLSGGQKQRLSIARALLKKPRLLILDDSTSALDGTTEQKLRAGIREWCKGITVIQIAQRISTVKTADKILVLQDGKIVGLGKHDELSKTCRVYQEIVESQES